MKISIITITYNSARTLTRAIQSVCRQTYKDIEHIIVDGESADATLSIIKEFASQYPQIKYISEQDYGIYDAINKGISMATGDIIGILNSDDELADNSVLEHIVQTMEDTQADILYGDLVYCKYEALKHNPPTIVRYWKSQAFDPKSLKRGWMPAHPTIYCRKRVFDTVGLYRTDYRISADYEFILRAFSCKELKKTYLNQILVKMEVGGISNRNLCSICLKTKEDIRVMHEHKMNIVIGILGKNLSKLNQFFKS